GGERRRQHDLDAGEVLGQRAELAHVRERLRERFVHLPVRREDRGAHYASTCTPGRVRPPRNSSEAPPPVEMWVILPATPARVTAATESPPPMMVVPWTAATARATPIVPAANASISNTPIGPFHTTVLARPITSA